MFECIDIHNHLIPGVDDGPEDIEECISGLNLLYNNGVKRIFITPHILNGKGLNWVSVDELKTDFFALKSRIKKMLSLELSAEYRFSSYIEDFISNKNILTIFGSSYFLVDFWGYTDLNILKNFITYSNRYNYNPIIAHPERSFSKDEIKWFNDCGYPIQMNLGSLIGIYGDEVMKVAEWIFERDIANFIATDSHSLESVKGMVSYLKKCEATLPLKNKMHRLFCEAPLKILKVD